MLHRNILKVLLIGLITVSFIQARGYGKGRGRSQGQGMGGNFANTCVQLPAQDVDAKEKAALLYMREEEKLARDVYLTLYEKYALPIFQNIAGSESRHTLAVKALLDKYKIEDPVHSDSVGMFTDQELKKLYTNWLPLGINR